MLGCAQVFCIWFLLASLFSEFGFSEGPQEKTRLKGQIFQEHRIEDFVDTETRALVLVFAGTKCPLIRQYLPTLSALNKRFESQGVRFLAIYPDRQQSIFEISEHALVYDVPFRALHDQEGLLAKRYSAKVIGEVVVLNPKLDVIYRGAIDDQYTPTTRKAAAERHYLKDALEEHLSGLAVTNPATTPSGCFVEYPVRKPMERKLNYNRDIAPIFERHCQECHRPGQIGASFDTFLDYDSVFRHLTTIQEAINDRRMPPYYGLARPDYPLAVKEIYKSIAPGMVLPPILVTNHPRLSGTELAILNDWIRAGAPEGSPEEAPVKKRWENPEWLLGKPDHTIEMAEPYPVPAVGVIDYQFFKMPLNLAEDRWVQAIEMVAGEPRVVHHMELHLVPHGNEDYSGPSGMTKLYGITGDNAKLLTGFAPGDTQENARRFPSGFAMRIPKGHDLVLEMHYTTAGETLLDRSRVGLHWAKEAPQHELCTYIARYHRSKLHVPPGEGHWMGQKAIGFRKDIWMVGLRGHMHKIGKSWKLEWVTPLSQGKSLRELFVGIPIWDFNWQRSIDFEKPVFVPAGQQLLMTGYWDNSRFNPIVSDPTKAVDWGIQTSDEMLNTRFKFYIDRKEGESVQCHDAQL